MNFITFCGYVGGVAVSDERVTRAAQQPRRYFPFRRVPGTASLAFANFIASMLLIAPDGFDVGAVNSVAADLAPSWAYGLGFFFATFFLTLSLFTRRWTHLNIGSALSLFMWTFYVGLIAASVIQGLVTVSPIAYALLAWMIGGQYTMLFSPLWYGSKGEGRGYE